MKTRMVNEKVVQFRKLSYISDSNKQSTATPNEESNEECTSSDYCGGNQSKPFQPRIGLAVIKKRQGKQNRLFNCAWYRDYSWLTFCISQQKVFCFYCRKAAATCLLFSNSRADSTLITKGFNNWKKAWERFGAHEKNQVHREACLIQSSQTTLSKNKIISSSCKRSALA